MFKEALITPDGGASAAEQGEGAKPVEAVELSKSTITDEKLFFMNKCGGILHLAQGILMLAVFLGVDRVNKFGRPVSYSYMYYVPATQNFAQASKLAFNAKIGLLTPLFLFMSAAAHAFIVFFWREGYIAGINKNINRARWYEYAASSSLMIVMIAILFGCWDLSSLIGMVGCNASMNLFGLLMEEANDLNTTKEVNWTSFWVGCFAGVVPWVQVLIAFLGQGNYSNIPGFVYGLLIGYFIFFNIFPLNMYLQYSRWNKWADYRYGEVVYIWLSLLSKSLLAWLVFGGTMQPNGEE
jgi:hypothetical protein